MASVKNKPAASTGKTAGAKTSVGNARDQRGNGDELHQSAGGQHPALTTNQGLPLSDNQNSLKASPRGPTLLETSFFAKKSLISTMSVFPSASCTRADRRHTAISS